MTAADLANQQLITAWVSACAAVVQALGAIAAIWISVALARQSAARERHADEQAARRAHEADKAAEARAVAADKAAEARLARNAIEQHNSVIDRIAALTRLALVEFREQEKGEHAKLGGELGMIQGGLGGKGLTTLMLGIPDLCRETNDVPLLSSMSKLQDLESELIYSGQGFTAYDTARSAAIQKIIDAVSEIQTHRR